MKILITGANGFVGKNLTAEFSIHKDKEILPFDIDTPKEKLKEYAKICDFVLHFAGVNRPQTEEEFSVGNTGFTGDLIDALQEAGSRAPILMTSSIQAALDNSYGQSKLAAEKLLLAYEKETGVPVYVYRMPNIFGKWCRPNYNSAVATFCHNTARGLPITVTDPDRMMELVYIDDIIEEIFRAMDGNVTKNGDYCTIAPVHNILLGDLANLIASFPESRKTLKAIDMSDPLTKKMYATYLSYIPKEALAYDLKMNVDDRGSFTEFLKSPAMGQVSVNIAHPGIVKGNHWHHTKNEKFLVVAGKGVIRFKHYFEDDIIEYHVDGAKLTVLDIPTGYSHNIENTGDTDLVTLMWASEPFDPGHPDTYFMPL